MTQILSPTSRGPQPRRKPSGTSYAEIEFCFLRAKHLQAGLTATTALAASSGLQNPSSFSFLGFFFKPHVNFFLVNLSTTAFPTRCQGAAEKSGDVLTPTCSADLLKFTFPDDSRLGRCAKSGSADTPPAARLPFLLTSFPRSTLCQTYSSGVAQYLYICQAQRENESCTRHAALKKQPNFSQTLFAVEVQFCSKFKV